MHSLKRSPKELKERADSVAALNNKNKVDELINSINSRINAWYKLCIPNPKIYINVSHYNYPVIRVVINRLSNEGYRVSLERNGHSETLVIDCGG